MTLNNLDVGQSAEIFDLAVQDSNQRQKLLSMGFVPGTQITLERVAPLGCPVEFSLRGYSLFIRRELAEQVVVQATDLQVHAF